VLPGNLLRFAAAPSRNCCGTWAQPTATLPVLPRRCLPGVRIAAVVAAVSLVGVRAGFGVCFRWRSCGVDASVSSGGQAQLRHSADPGDDDQQCPEHRGHDSCARRESSGAAAVWRFSDASIRVFWMAAVTPRTCCHG
jgi:hypothetical protein